MQAVRGLKIIFVKTLTRCQTKDLVLRSVNYRLSVCQIGLQQTRATIPEIGMDCMTVTGPDLPVETPASSLQHSQSNETNWHDILLLKIGHFRFDKTLWNQRNLTLCSKP